MYVDTGLERETIKAYAHKVSQKDDEVKYEGIFVVPASFGQVGAVLLENEHHKEMYLSNIVLEGFPNGPLHFTCNSWLHSKYDNPHKRIFFNNKVSTNSSLKYSLSSSLLIHYIIYLSVTIRIFYLNSS